MPNGWLDKAPEVMAFLKSEEGQKRIAEWKQEYPNLRLPIWLQGIWNEEEASKCKT